jgi:hypothetical protein
MGLYAQFMYSLFLVVRLTRCMCYFLQVVLVLPVLRLWQSQLPIALDFLQVQVLYRVVCPDIFFSDFFVFLFIFVMYI